MKLHSREQMNIVIVGHVDHGKSSVIGRLMADTHSLPEGKLEAVKSLCKKNAKPFEYAFLLDALKDEQAQGITIDTARCFFKTHKRDYIILDAPGHIEFLKNMITGASRAEAALLVIDAQEGIQENSKRHGHMVSMLGIKQVVILVNKMDLADYSRERFDEIKRDYTQFLKHINIDPVGFIPISALEGDGIIGASPRMGWYDGKSVLEQIDSFRKQDLTENQPFRLPVQDIYKFTNQGDDRRIVAGTIASGSISEGDRVTFYPSGKHSRIHRIEQFNSPPISIAGPGEAPGFTLETQIYIQPGEIMVKDSDPPPRVSNRFKANIFWMGKAPLTKGASYKLKLAASKSNVRLVDILSVLDASDLSSQQNKGQVDRHDVAECIFETSKPIAFDLAGEIEETARIVLVDQFEIAGGGILLESLHQDPSILKKHIADREDFWERGLVTREERERFNGHQGKMVIIAGQNLSISADKAKELERKLFQRKINAYYLGLSSLRHGLDWDLPGGKKSQDDHLLRLGELARVLTDAGHIFITALGSLEPFDLEKLRLLTQPNEILVVSLGGEDDLREKADVVLDLSDEVVRWNDLFRQLEKRDIIPPSYHI